MKLSEKQFDDLEVLLLTLRTRYRLRKARKGDLVRIALDGLFALPLDRIAEQLKAQKEGDHAQQA